MAAPLRTAWVLPDESVLGKGLAAVGAAGNGDDAVTIVPQAIDNRGQTPAPELTLCFQGRDGTEGLQVVENHYFLTHFVVLSLSHSAGMTR